MWPSREADRLRLIAALQTYHTTVRRLPGLEDPRAVATLAMQCVASMRREDYYRLVQQKRISATRADPHHPTFDAERAVAFYVQNGNVDEAVWLIFLMTYFARPADSGWVRLQDVYGRLGQGIGTGPLSALIPPRLPLGWPLTGVRSEENSEATVNMRPYVLTAPAIWPASSKTMFIGLVFRGTGDFSQM